MRGVVGSESSLMFPSGAGAFTGGKKSRLRREKSSAGRGMW